MTLWKNALTFVASVAVAAAVTVMPASALTLKEIKDKGTITVGSLVDYPPFGLLDSNGQAVGYDPDLAKEFADSIGVKLTILPVTSANRIQYLLSGQADVLFATLGITEERLKVVNFSVPYAGLEQFVYGDKDIAITDKAGLAGQTIGVTRGTTQDTAVTAIAAADTNVQRYDDDASSAQALISGQVPLLGVADIAIGQIEKTAPDRFTKKFLLRQQAQGIVVRKDSPELLAAVNDFLNGKKKDGSLGKLHEQWMKAPLPAFIENAEK
ncbi:transporter substrate-binding domain-containing protein [Mesorhizobium sp. B2-5-3]|uniref:transporter substrate-binding domain-containing protein n=1 Tax=Mesorhizobium sp. B2-5-3 TaxID=2589927 RepID=UPI00112976A7|nr:transporter substrate-binding domain-containing protein [Mesorhizobium sp. B2-5-3]TPK33940.1 transporter substrate-binding domain-containing protein [Mesorhizobium sp. B2-5-3]